MTSRRATMPTQAPTVIPVPGGSSNALINSGTTMYVMGQQLKPDGLLFAEQPDVWLT